MSSVSGIQGQILDVTVVGCSKLRDTELFSRQDPYVCIEYANSKFRTRTCTDGGRNPTFQEKFQIPLIEGLRDINVTVWNSNTFTIDDFIGQGRVQLQKVLTQGYDDSSWPLQSRNQKFGGEVKVILHFQNALKPSAYPASSVPPYLPTAPPQACSPYTPGAYPATPYSSYPPMAAQYPTSTYPPPPVNQAYPPQAYPPTYPPQPYVQQYPPPPTQPYYPPGPYPGAYPPPY